VRNPAQEQRREERTGQTRLSFGYVEADMLSQGLRMDRASQRGRAEKMLYDLLEESAQPYDALLRPSSRNDISHNTS